MTLFVDSSDRSGTGRFRPQRIVSGGQTGVDRGALRAAIELGIPHGGWCPRGRVAEDGAIPPEFQLTETPTKEYASRTEHNVIDSDATLILHRGAKLQGGTRLTKSLAIKHKRPYLVLHLDQLDSLALETWLEQHRPQTLNVAGPRESSDPGIEQQTKRLLCQVLAAR